MMSEGLKLIDILLVYPPVNRLCEMNSNFFPIGLGYLAAVTNQMGYITRIYNAELDTKPFPPPTNRSRIDNHHLFVEALENDRHPVWEEYREVIRTYQPKIVGFSCTSASVNPCLKMACDAKEICDPVVVFGGMHPTILPEETAREPVVDYIVVGEAEKSFAVLAEKILSGETPVQVPGIGGFYNGEFFLNPQPPMEKDIDQFPFPDRDALIFPDEHRKYLKAIVSSRGCPYRCTFCSGNKIHGGVVRYRSVDSILAEIRLLKDKYSVTHVTFYDDSFLLDRKRVKQLCRRMIAEELNIKWSGFVRVNLVDPGILELMRISGCIFLGIGVESGSDYILKKIKKGYNRARAIQAVKWVKESGIDISINIIIGFPFEREQDIRDTISLIAEVKVTTNINTFTPYPRSEIYEECVETGLLDGNVDWRVISQHSAYNTFVKEVSPSLYKELLDQMIAASDAVNRRNLGTGDLYNTRMVFELNDISEIPLNERIMIYGTGEGSRVFLDRLKTQRKDVTLAAFLDTFKRGKKEGVSILKPEDLKANEKNASLILITSMHWQEMEKKLYLLDISNYKVVPSHLLRSGDNS